MKRKLSLSLMIVMLLLVFQPLTTYGNTPEAHADQKFTVTVNDVFVPFSEYLGEPMLLKTARTVVPIRVVSENMGYKVTWDQEAYEATIDNGEKTVVIHVGTPYATINGEKIYIDYTGEGASKKPVPETQSFIKESRTYVPLRFITEAFDGKVEYERLTSGTHKITITTPDYVPPTTGGKISFDPAKDILPDGRMTVEKTREYLNAAIDHFTVTPNSFSYEKMDLPEGFRLEIALSILGLEPGTGYRFNTSPVMENHRIPVNESFTRTLDPKIAGTADYVLTIVIGNEHGTASRYEIMYEPNYPIEPEIMRTNIQGGFDDFITWDYTRIFQGF